MIEKGRLKRFSDVLFALPAHLNRARAQKGFEAVKQIGAGADAPAGAGAQIAAGRCGAIAQLQRDAAAFLAKFGLTVIPILS